MSKMNSESLFQITEFPGYMPMVAAYADYFDLMGKTNPDEQQAVQAMLDNRIEEIRVTHYPETELPSGMVLLATVEAAKARIAARQAKPEDFTNGDVA